MKMNRIASLIFGVVMPALALHNTAQAAAASAKFGSKWQALVGEWNAENASGGNSGACGFHLDLADHIIVRTNHVVVTPAGGGAASAHDDLMVIYPATPEDKGKAIYFDNESHVIEYDAEWSADGNTLTFLSKPGAGPQFRLIYKKAEAKSFDVTFEMTAPGQTTFKLYTSGKMKRERN